AFFEKTCVTPYLFGVKMSEVLVPLNLLQCEEANKEGTLKMFSAINAVLPEDRLSDTALERTFNLHWPKFKETLEKIDLKVPPAPKRSASDVLEEILGIVRELRRSRFDKSPLAQALPDPTSLDFKKVLGLIDNPMLRTALEEAFLK